MRQSHLPLGLLESIFASVPDHRRLGPMADASAAQQACSVEVLVDVVDPEGGNESFSGFGLDPTLLARGLSIGVWLNYLRLSLPVGSKFLVQSHGRWVNSQETCFDEPIITLTDLSW